MARQGNKFAIGCLAAVLAALLIASKPINVSGKMILGINLGLMGDNLPDVSRIVELLSNLHVSAVRLYDANPEVLNALSNTPHEVIVSVRNDELADIGTRPDAADAWVLSNVKPFYPATKITFIAVGNEVLREGNVETNGQYLLQALTNIYSSLESCNLHNAIKVISPLSGEILGTSWPPAAGFFDRLQYVLPLLHFLEDTGSIFFINLYPYYAHIADNVAVSFEFASFQSTSPAFLDPLSNLPYSNLFESMLDASYNAMASLGFPDLPLAVGETGWPTAGGHAATIENAELFNKNLIQHVYNKGTPQRPDVRTPVFIFALFDENQKPGPAFERHWGLLNADGTPIYPIDLADPGVVLDVPTLPLPPAAPADGTAGEPIDLADPNVLDARSLPEAGPGVGTPLYPIDLDDPGVVQDARTLPLPPAAPADGTAVKPIDLADPNVLDNLDATSLPEAGPAYGTPVNPIDVADPTSVLEAPSLPVSATAAQAADAASIINSISLTDPTIVLGAPVLPSPAAVPEV